MSFRICWLFVLGGLMGCGQSSRPPPGPGVVDAGAMLCTPAGGTPVDASAVQATCAAEVLRLDVTVAGGGALPDGSRLAVVWGSTGNAHLDGCPRMAWEGAVAAGRVEVRLSELALPPREAVMCSRACRDRTACPCLDLPQVALASVVVATDADGDGRLSVQEAQERTLGLAPVLVGWSIQRHDPVPPRPYFWQNIFTRSVEEGTCLYPVIRGEQREALGLGGAGDSYELRVCASGNGCGVTMPRL